MRIRVGISVLVWLAGCSTAARSPAPVASREPDAAVAAVTAPPIAPDAGPTAAAKPEDPLAWGTRPPMEGPFFPVIEGDCALAAVHPLDDGNALFSYGHDGGSTMARFTNDGVEDVSQSKHPAFRAGGFFNVHGSWPEPLLAMNSDREGNRARNYETLWAHRADGWVSIISHRDPEAPEMTTGGFFRGNAIVQRHPGGRWGGMYEREGTVDAIPVVEGAKKLTGVVGLRRADMERAQLTVGNDEIYLLGTFQLPFDPSGNVPPQFAQILHVWRDGKVREVKLPPGTADRIIVATKPNLVIVTKKRELRRLVEGDKWEPVAFDVGPKDEILSMTAAPDGSTWFRVDPDRRIVRRDASGRQEEMKPPSDTEKMPATEERWSRGTYLVGVEHGDPWALSTTGTLSHFVDGAWQRVTIAGVRLRGVDVVAKGDVFAVGSLDEKLPGWSRPLTRTEVFRTKRPKEVLRCNEGMTGLPNGRGLMSFPPRATAACKTPFVVLLRTAFKTSTPKPKVIFDAKAEYKDIREAVKGETSELVEIATGDQRYLGFVPSSVEGGTRAILAVAKTLKPSPDFRPEVVCGTPPAAVRTIKLEP